MNHNQVHNAYQTTNGMVRKTRQVVMLYDGVVRFLQQAGEAIEKNDVQTRYNALSKSCEIINGLQLSLDMERGGEVATLLYDYYAGLDMALLSVHQSQDLKMVDSCIRNIKVMRDAWVEIDEAEAKKELSSQSDDALYDQSIADKLTARQSMSSAELDALSSLSVSV